MLKFLWIASISSCVLFGQVPEPAAAKASFERYYAGEWTGQGEFSNGQKISAKVSFRVDKDVDGLLYRHVDDPPNVYRSISIWKIDTKSDQLVASIHDPFGRVRLFVSPEWRNRKLTLDSINAFGDPKFSKERFIYEPLTDDSFKMTYQVDAKGTGEWKTGDSLVFRRLKG